MNTTKAAQLLGRSARGKKKTLTQAERKRRAARLAKARKSRWNRPKPVTTKVVSADFSG